PGPPPDGDGERSVTPGDERLAVSLGQRVPFRYPVSGVHLECQVHRVAPWCRSSSCSSFLPSTSGSMGTRRPIGNGVLPSSSQRASSKWTPPLRGSSAACSCGSCSSRSTSPGG